MKYIHNKAFPYPVLSQNDDFVGCGFQADVQWIVEKETHQIKLCVEFLLSEDNLIKLVKEKKALFSVEVHCSKTYTRKIFTGTGEGKQPSPHFTYTDAFLFSANELSGQVITNCYIISNNESATYHSTNFNKDYGNTKFHIEEGNVLAVYEPIIHHFDTEQEKPVGTFLRLVPNNELPLGRFKIDYDDENYINIMLHQKTKASIELMRNQKSQKKALWSAFLFPAILEILHEMQDGRDDHNSKYWFIGISKSLVKLDPPIDFDKNKQNDLLMGAQQLMHNPIEQIVPRDDSND